MELLVGALIFKALLRVKKDSEAIFTTPLKVAFFVQSQADYLLARFHLLYHFKSLAVEKLQIAFV